MSGVHTIRQAQDVLLKGESLAEKLKRNIYWEQAELCVQLEIAAQLADVVYELGRISGGKG